MVMFSPSHIFLMVEMVVLLFLPLVILCKVDWVTPEIVASLLIVILLDRHNSCILLFTASPIVIKITSLLKRVNYIIW